MNPWFLHRRLDRGHVNLTWLADDGSPQNRTKNGSDSGPGPWQPDDDYGGELSSISVVPHPNPVGSRSRDSLGTCPAARWRALATRGSAGGIGSEDIGWAIFIVDFIKPKRKLMDPPRLPPLGWGGGTPSVGGTVDLFPSNLHCGIDISGSSNIRERHAHGTCTLDFANLKCQRTSFFFRTATDFSRFRPEEFGSPTWPVRCVTIDHDVHICSSWFHRLHSRRLHIIHVWFPIQ